MVTVEKAGWFYLATYLKDDKYEPKTGACTLFVRYIERLCTAGGSRIRFKTDALSFANEDAMVEWIDEHDAQELPSEAEGDPRYVPPALNASNPAKGNMGGVLHQERVDHLRRAAEFSPASEPKGAAMTTSWRVVDFDGWAFDGPQVTLTYDDDDDETIAVIEAAAEGAGVELERIEQEEAKPAPDLSDSLE